MKEEGLRVEATRERWQRHRNAIHFVYSGGRESPGPGTVIRYGRNIFYAALDFESFLSMGNDLYLMDNGVVLSYVDVPAMRLSFHYRPPHEQDPGGLRHEKRQAEAGVSCSLEQETPSQAAGGSLSGEVPSSSSGAAPKRPKPMPQKKPKVAPSPQGQGDVPTLNEDELREMIKQDELREQRKRHPTSSVGETTYPYEAGDTVHGKVNVGSIRRQEEIQEILKRARANPWHLYHHGVLKRMDANNRPASSHYGDGQVKVTPWDALSKEARALLGEEYKTMPRGCFIPCLVMVCISSSERLSTASSKGTTSPSSFRSRTPM